MRPDGRSVSCSTLTQKYALSTSHGRGAATASAAAPIANSTRPIICCCGDGRPRCTHSARPADARAHRRWRAPAAWSGTRRSARTRSGTRRPASRTCPPPTAARRRDRCGAMSSSCSVTTIGDTALSTTDGRKNATVASTHDGRRAAAQIGAADQPDHRHRQRSTARHPAPSSAAAACERRTGRPAGRPARCRRRCRPARRR